MFQITHLRSLARLFAQSCFYTGKPEHVETFHSVDGLGLQDNEYIAVTYRKIIMDSNPTCPNLGALAEKQKAKV